MSEQQSPSEAHAKPSPAHSASPADDDDAVDDDDDDDDDDDVDVVTLSNGAGRPHEASARRPPLAGEPPCATARRDRRRSARNARRVIALGWEEAGRKEGNVCVTSLASKGSVPSRGVL